MGYYTPKMLVKLVDKTMGMSMLVPRLLETLFNFLKHFWFWNQRVCSKLGCQGQFNMKGKNPSDSSGLAHRIAALVIRRNNFVKFILCRLNVSNLVFSITYKTG